MTDRRLFWLWSGCLVRKWKTKLSLAADSLNLSKPLHFLYKDRRFIVKAHLFHQKPKVLPYESVCRANVAHHANNLASVHSPHTLSHKCNFQKSASQTKTFYTFSKRMGKMKQERKRKSHFVL